MDDPVVLRGAPAVPIELQQLRQWLVHTGKVPANGASSTDPATWVTYDEAIYVAQFLIKTGRGGIGFVFGPDDPYVGVDLDHCVDDGAVHPAAQAIIDALDSYWELSPSGTGVHVIVRGEPPDGYGNRTTGPWGGSLEIYDRARYFTVTGKGQGEIAERTAELGQIVREYLEPAPPVGEAARGPGNDLNDDEVLGLALEARNAEKFAALWAGNWSSYYSSQSEADLAFCGMLAFWTGGDPEQIDRVFRASGLMREKWERVGETTISRAIQGRTEFFGLPSVRPSYIHTPDGRNSQRAVGPREPTGPASESLVQTKISSVRPPKGLGTDGRKRGLRRPGLRTQGARR